MNTRRRQSQSQGNVTYVQFGATQPEKPAPDQHILPPIERPIEVRGTSFSTPGKNEKDETVESFDSVLQELLHQNLGAAWPSTPPASINLEGKTLFSDFAVTSCEIRPGNIKATVDDGWHRIVDVEFEALTASTFYSTINHKHSVYAQFFVQTLSSSTREVIGEMCRPLQSATWACSCSLAQTQPVCPHMVAVETFLADRVRTNPWELIRMTVSPDVGTTFGTLKRIAQQHLVADSVSAAGAGARTDDEELLRPLPVLPSVTLPPAVFAGQSDYLLAALTHVTRGTREALNVRFWIEEFYHTLETKPPLIDPRGNEEME